MDTKCDAAVDAINRAAERMQNKRMACAVQASSWDGINDTRAAVLRCLEEAYADAHSILREEYP